MGYIDVNVGVQLPNSIIFECIQNCN